MLLLPHTLVSVALSLKVEDTFLAILLAFLAHIALYLVPHWEPSGLSKSLESVGKARLAKKTKIFVAGDFLISLAFGLLFVWKALPDTAFALRVFLVAFFGNLPDGASFLLLCGKRWGILLRIWELHSRTHLIRPSLFWGVLTQVFVVAAGLLLVLQ